MNAVERPFLPGRTTTNSLPLARYLPAMPAGMVLSWLQQNVSPGEFILDPLGATPALALEAARAGYRVIVASNNPIGSFMLQVLASAPKKNEFQAALSDLADSRRGNERLEVYLQSLYHTECAACGKTVVAQAFLWKRDEKQPYARLYRCPNCGDEGERPITHEDLKRLESLGSDQLHRARALGRVSLEKDLAAARAKEAIDVYLPRPLDFLLTLMNKIEGLQLSPERSRLLLALALSAADSGNSLWPYPFGRNRPRQLSTPPQFRENNLWAVMEAAIEDWCRPEASPVALTFWPKLPPPEGGICIYQGRLRSLLPLPDDVELKAALTVVPRPNQAFWTLSAVWAGWLWGRQAVLPLKSALERRRYDWQWHTNALQNAFLALRKHVPDGFPLFGLMPELVPGFLSAVMIAAETSDFVLDSLALRSDQIFGQATWFAGKCQSRPSTKNIEGAAREAIYAHLQQRGEPTTYLLLHAASLVSILREGILPAPAGCSPGDAVSTIQSSIDRVFADSNFLRRYESSAQSNESGQWWLSNPTEVAAPPLADQVEMALVRYLHKADRPSLTEIETTLLARFPGLMTPPAGLIRACLDSYGEPDPQSRDFCQLREQEKPAARKQDILDARGRLIELGLRLGYTPTGENPLAWTAPTGEAAYLFYLFASSMIGRFVLAQPPISPSRCILVLPGSRSNLLAFKLARDPHLSEASGQGWRFLKFRHVARLLEYSNITRERFDELLAQDPIRWEEPTQMRMFEE